MFTMSRASTPTQIIISKRAGTDSFLSLTVYAVCGISSLFSRLFMKDF